MWQKIKDFLHWVYNWITVLSTVVVGGLVYLPPLLDAVSPNLEPLLPPNKAVAIMAIIGIIKGLCALVQSRLKS